MTLGPNLELNVYIIDEGARWEGSALSRTISCLNDYYFCFSKEKKKLAVMKKVPVISDCTG